MLSFSGLCLFGSPLVTSTNSLTIRRMSAEGGGSIAWLDCMLHGCTLCNYEVCGHWESFWSFFIVQVYLYIHCILDSWLDDFHYIGHNTAAILVCSYPYLNQWSDMVHRV